MQVVIMETTSPLGIAAYLVVKGASDAIAFYKEAFGAEERLLIATRVEEISNASFQEKMNAILTKGNT